MRKCSSNSGSPVEWAGAGTSAGAGGFGALLRSANGTCQPRNIPRAVGRSPIRPTRAPAAAATRRVVSNHMVAQVFLERHLAARPVGTRLAGASMPRRDDLHTIMVIGSGPIVIGQACEFDYSGCQACKALKKLGYRVVLLNSNPATIMTDPEMADATYVEPLTLEFATQVIARERPDAVLPTVGGQTGLNLAMELHKAGVLEKYDVELIGARPDAIEVAEDRELFRQAMMKAGLEVAKSGTAINLPEAEILLGEVGLPAIIRPSFTLGGAGGGIAYNIDEFRD